MGRNSHILRTTYTAKGNGCSGESDKSSVAGIGRDRVDKVRDECLNRQLDLGRVVRNNIFANDSIHAFVRSFMQRKERQDMAGQDRAKIGQDRGRQGKTRQG